LFFPFPFLPFSFIHAGAIGQAGGLSTRRARTATGLLADNIGEDEPSDGETEEGDGDIIERLPFDDPFHCWDESEHAAECEQNGDELILPDVHALTSRS